MSVLNKIDKAAESKGALVVKIWQFIKFNIVSLSITVVQLVLANFLQ